jgi:hypothetical protein
MSSKKQTQPIEPIHMSPEDIEFAKKIAQAIVAQLRGGEQVPINAASGGLDPSQPASIAPEADIFRLHGMYRVLGACANAGLAAKKVREMEHAIENTGINISAASAPLKSTWQRPAALSLDQQYLIVQGGLALLEEAGCCRFEEQLRLVESKREILIKMHQENTQKNGVKRL